MRDLPHSPPSVVVGIDGSRSALDAALWAVDEAVSRDIPLRLVYAVDPDDSSGADPQDAARDLADRRDSGSLRVHGGRVDRQARQDRGGDPAGPAGAGADRSLQIGRNALPGRHGPQTQRTGPDRFHGCGSRGLRPLPGGHRPRL